MIGKGEEEEEEEEEKRKEREREYDSYVPIRNFELTNNTPFQYCVLEAADGGLEFRGQQNNPSLL